MFTFELLKSVQNIQVGIWIPILASIVILGCNGQPAKKTTATLRSKPVNNYHFESQFPEQLPQLWAGVDHPDMWLVPPERRDFQLDVLRDSGIQIIRIVLSNRERDLWWKNPPYAVALENPIGQFHWDVLMGVDELMVACRARGLHLWIVLGDMDEYVQTFGPRGAYEERMAIDAYTRRIRALLAHTNSRLGRRWYECDDVVYAWEIADRAGETLAGAALEFQQANTLFRAWSLEMSRAIKILDPESRVALGVSSRGRFDRIPDENDLWELGQIPMVDIYTLRGISGADELKAINREGIGSGAAIAQEKLRHCIRNAKDLASNFHKQIVLVPFGAERRTGMGESLLFYRTAIQIAEEENVPWIVHRFGDRYDEQSGTGDSAFVLTPYDVVWREVIAPAARRLAGHMASE